MTLPETCGACEHFRAPRHRCDHPSLDRDVTLLSVALYPPPLICPIRHAEEIRIAREAGQTEGAYWMQDECCEQAGSVSSEAEDLVAALSPPTVCAEARTNAEARTKEKPCRTT